MQRTLTIAKREFRSYFNSPAAYIVVCLFLLFLGFFFWNPFFLINRASVRSMFDLMSVLLLPTAPAKKSKANRVKVKSGMFPAWTV